MSSDPLTFTGGTITLAGADILFVNNTTTFNDQVTGAAATLDIAGSATSGTGVLALNNSTNNYSNGGGVGTTGNGLGQPRDRRLFGCDQRPPRRHHRHIDVDIRHSPGKRAP